MSRGALVLLLQVRSAHEITSMSHSQVLMRRKCEIRHRKHKNNKLGLKRLYFMINFMVFCFLTIP